MNISKNQVIMLSIGGVSLVASLALGYFTYDAWTTKSELAEEIESESSSVRSLLRADVSPDKASVVDIGKNRAKVTGWCEAALSVAASGDKLFPTNVNPTAVKEKIVSDARELSKLPGDVDGKIVKPDFGFGFPEFVMGDKIPEKARLGQIQRQWYDVSLLVRTLSDCGVAEITEVKAAPPPKVQEEDPKAARRNRNAKKGVEEKPLYTSERYELEFRADGPALAKAVNAIATSERFFVIDSLDFYRKEDPLASALGGDDKKKEGAQSAKPVRRRLRRSESDEESAAKEKGEEKKNGPICGPGAMPPFIVKAVVVSYDFGTAAQKAEAERAESAPADADKDSAKDKKEDSK